MSELFKLKPCEECNGTGDAHHQGHDYDCPDCLGTGYEEPAKRIMNLELKLNGYNVLLQSSDTRYYKIAQKLEIALEQRDRLAAVLQRIRDGYGGQVASPNCCADCDYLLPIDEALQSLTPKP
jgi:transposase